MFGTSDHFEGLTVALDTIRAERVTALSDDELERGFAELQRVGQVVEAERLRRLSEIHRRQSHRRAGHLSTSSWLVEQHRMGWAAAAKDIRTARSLERMPRTREALADGELTPSAVQMLVAARHAHPAQFHGAESALVEAAKRLPAPQLHRTVSHWRQQLDWDEGLKDAERLREQRRLNLSPTTLGMVKLDGDLDPETGEAVLQALRDCVDAERRGRRSDDERTPAQRRVDALGEVCRLWLSHPSRGPSGAGERPNVAVIVDVRALQGEVGHRSELECVGPVHPETVRRIACDAAISRVITRGASEPLDVGRKTAVVSSAMRRALIVRDRHCRFPGCDRPPPWCDAHHIHHWANGGATAVANLALLCRPHHRLVHEGRFELRLERGTAIVSHPVDSPMERPARTTADAEAVSRWRLPSAARPADSAPPRIPSGAPG